MNEISSDLPSDVAASDVVTDDKINNPAKSIELKITALENDMRLDRFIRQHYPSIGHIMLKAVILFACLYPLPARLMKQCRIKPMVSQGDCRLMKRHW